MPRRTGAEPIDYKVLVGGCGRRISCCMIASDEGRSIARAIESVRDLADEVIVVDTGSSDGTAAEARRSGARLLYAPWRDDFSAARNVALAHATGEWILVLDADEEIARSDHAPIRDLAARGEAEAFTFEQRTYGNEPATYGLRPIGRTSEMTRGASGFVSCRQIRLFRNVDHIEYRGRVFERVEASLLERGARAADADPVVHHYGRLEPDVRIYRNALAWLSSPAPGISVHRSNVNYVYEVAVQLLALRHLDASSELADACLGADPTCWQFLNLRGLLHLGRGEVEAAIDRFRSAVEAKGDASELYYNIGTAYLNTGRPGRALESLERGIDLCGEDAGLLEQAAAASLKLAAVERACRFVERVLERDPHRPNAHLLMAEVCSARNDRDGALREIGTLRFFADVPLVVYLRGIHLSMRMGAVAEAQRLLGSAMERHPDSGELLFLRAKMLEFAGEDEKALAEYRRMLGGDHRTSAVLTSVGCLYERRGELARALQALGEAYRLSPDDRHSEVNLAIVLQKVGRTAEAERRLRCILAHRADDGTACNALGCLLANRGEYPEAIPYFERAVALEPENARFRFNLDLANRKILALRT